jgi:hypothetical protein
MQSNTEPMKHEVKQCKTSLVSKNSIISSEVIPTMLNNDKKSVKNEVKQYQLAIACTVSLPTEVHHCWAMIVLFHIMLLWSIINGHGLYYFTSYSRSILTVHGFYYFTSCITGSSLLKTMHSKDGP